MKHKQSKQMGGVCALSSIARFRKAMAAAGYFSLGSPSKSMEIRWISTRGRPNGRFKPSRIQLYISTDPSHIVLQDLSQLYTTCNHSCYRFPDVLPESGLNPEVDVDKLRLAVSHSAVLVSVFCKPRDQTDMGLLERVLESAIPVSPSNGQLVGFGRAVSDLGLTASIYDVMVIPSLRRMGIGKIIVNRIIRMLRSRDIYDIAALCSEEERLFLKACGFGEDMLGSTTMMYTRTAPAGSGGKHMVKRAGRKLLLLPPC